MTITPKQDMAKAAAFTPPSTPFKVLSSDRRGPAAANPASAPDLQVPLNGANSQQMDEDEDELDQLLSLQKPVTDVTANQPGSVAYEESSVPEKGKCIWQARFFIFFSPQLKGGSAVLKPELAWLWVSFILFLKKLLDYILVALD